MSCDRLISYIAFGAPATRRPARGDEPFLRPEIGFTPLWYRQALGIDFGERWHTDPAYREGSLELMAREVRRRFPEIEIGRTGPDGEPVDLLTGAYGGALVAALYGMPIRYAAGNWPTNEHRFIDEAALDRLTPPDLDRNPLFANLLDQMDWIERRRGRIEGFVNWQGVLNNAMRIRGQEIFSDMLLRPELARRLLRCVADTIRDGLRRVLDRQRRSGVEYRHATVSNCVVNMISPAQYREFLLPFDAELGREFGLLGIHNCAWDATPYLPEYARVPGVGYVDMGLDSDLPQARRLFPNARRALMYTPMDLARKPSRELRADFERIAREYGPCDVVMADIEAGTPDERVREAADLCAKISRANA